MAQQATPTYHRQNYHTHPPNPPLPLRIVEPDREWHHLIQRLPYSVSAAVTTRLSTKIPAPNGLHTGDEPSTVNKYLADVQQAFPHLPAAQKPRVNGAKILGREVACTTLAAIQESFPDMPQAFYAATTVGSEVRKQAGTLILVGTGANTIWEKSHIATDLRDQINTAQAANNSQLVKQLQVTLEHQRQLHQDGQTDRHNSVLFIKGRKLWLYDPSALTCQFIAGANSHAEQVFQQVQDDLIPPQGINCHGVANVNMAKEIFVRNYSNQGHAPLGRRDTVEGFYIGGGGNVIVRTIPGEFQDDIASDSRPMCGNFIALLATLLWAEIDTEGLTEEQVYEQRVNVDWVLGGFYNGLSKDDEQAQARGIPQWWKYQVY